MSLHSNNYYLPQALKESGDILVPWFQRDYSWDLDNIEQLFLDVFEEYSWDKVKARRGDVLGMRDYFMGTIVLCGDGQTRRMLLDGQQRLTTLSMLYAVVLRKMLQKATHRTVFAGMVRERAEDLFNNQGEPRLQPKPDDFEVYKAVISVGDLRSDVPLLDDANPSPQARAARERPIAESYVYLGVKLAEHIDAGVAAGFAEEEVLKIILQIVAQKLILVSIRTDDEDYAIKLFETLNARGADLNPDDLIKNALFLEVKDDPRGQDRVTSTWNSFVKKVPESGHRVDFLRYAWNAQRPFIGKSQVYSQYKQYFRDALSLSKPDRKQALSDFCAQMADGYNWYQQIEKPDAQHGFLNGLRIMNAKICRPLILAAAFAHPGLLPNDRRALVSDIVRICESAMHRTSICDQVTNSLEHGFQQAAMMLMSMVKEQKPWSEVLSVVRGILADPDNKVPDDDKVRNALRTSHLTPKDLKRYRWRVLLATLDRHAANNGVLVVPQVSQIKLSYITQGDSAVHQELGNIQISYLDASSGIVPALNPPATSLTGWGTAQIMRRTQEIAELAVRSFKL